MLPPKTLAQWTGVIFLAIAVLPLVSLFVFLWEGCRAVWEYWGLVASSFRRKT